MPVPSAIWSMIPPTAEPITGRPFHIPSETVSPKPSARLFCAMTGAGAARPGDDRLLGDGAGVAVAAHEPGGHLRRGIGKHANLGEDGPHGGSVEVLVLRGERVDRRRDAPDLVIPQPRWHVFPA